MKRRVLKEWVVMVLGFINILAVIFMASDFEDLTTFYITHTIALAIFIFNTIIIVKYGNKELFK